jgi:photosystem II stability/assembly factor-like uncharacterized protein
MKILKTKSLKLLLLLILSVLLSGCLPGGGGTSKIDGGVWRSEDGAKTLFQSNDILTTKGKIADISNLSVNRLTLDPQDTQSVYLATENNGIIYSLDGGTSWQQFKILNKGNVRDVKVDPKNKCIIYAISENKLFKSSNCGRDFSNAYFHQKADVAITALAIDSYNPKRVYIGTADGEILLSADEGNSWSAIFREDAVVDIVIDPYDTRIIYVGTQKKGIFKTTDSGVNWSSLGEGLKSYTGSHQYRRLIYDTASVDSLILISKFGMLKTENGGQSWKIIDLLPAHKTIDILATAVNPKNSNELYYVTANTLVKTTDGGATWSSRQLPYNRQTNDIVINPEKSEIVYFATAITKK